MGNEIKQLAEQGKKDEFKDLFFDKKTEESYKLSKLFLIENNHHSSCFNLIEVIKYWEKKCEELEKEIERLKDEKIIDDMEARGTDLRYRQLEKELKLSKGHSEKMISEYSKLQEEYNSISKFESANVFLQKRVEEQQKEKDEIEKENKELREKLVKEFIFIVNEYIDEIDKNIPNVFSLETKKKNANSYSNIINKINSLRKSEENRIDLDKSEPAKNLGSPLSSKRSDSQVGNQKDKKVTK